MLKRGTAHAQAATTSQDGEATRARAAARRARRRLRHDRPLGAAAAAPVGRCSLGRALRLGRRASAGCASSARKVSDSSRCRRPGASRRARARRRSRAPPASTRPRPRARAARASRAARSKRSSASRIRRTSELRRDRAVPVVLLQPERDVVAARLAGSGRAARPRPNAIALPGVAALVADAEAEVLALADGRELGELAVGREQGHVRVAEPERREPAQLGAEVERERDAARERRRRPAIVGTELVLGERERGLRGERVGERLDALGPDREAGRGAVPAEALEVARARAERAVQVERRDRSARALPELVAAGDQHDRTVEALDEPRGDDPDHALVPVLAREHVAARALPRLGPATRPGRRAARRIRSSTACRSRFSVSSCSASRSASPPVVGEDQLERRTRMPEPAGGVDPRREPEADRAGVDGGRVDVRRAHQRAQAGLARVRERAQPRDRERAVLVERAGRRRRSSRARRGRGAGATASLSTPSSACASLSTTPVPQSSGKGIVGRPRRHDRAVGQLRARPVVVGDDDVEAERARLGDLLDGRDPAVDGEHEPAALAGEPLDRRRS